MSNKEEPTLPEHAQGLLNSLSPDDVERLDKLLQMLRRVDGWCAVNRALAKWLIFTVIATLVIMSQGWDAVIRVAHFFRGQ